MHSFDYLRQIKAPWLLFLLVSITQNDQTGTFLPFLTERVTYNIIYSTIKLAARHVNCSPRKTPLDRCVVWDYKSRPAKRWSHIIPFFYGPSVLPMIPSNQSLVDVGGSSQLTGAEQGCAAFNPPPWPPSPAGPGGRWMEGAVGCCLFHGV